MSLITIGITAYREGDWLAECWQSVLAQSDPRWEAVIVLDDGADEQTRRIFEHLEHPRLTKITGPHSLGPYPARRTAIEASQTDWYAHLDADDRLPIMAIELILAAVEANPEVDYVYGECLYFGDGHCRINQFGHQLGFEALAKGPIITGTSPIRVDLFRRVGGFAPELFSGGADWDFWIGAYEQGARGVRAGGTIYERRVHGSSVGSRRDFDRVLIAETIIRRHPIFFNSEERRRRCLGNAHERVALSYGMEGKRKQAAIHAREALDYGSESPRLEIFVREAQMPAWRYAYRRLIRLLRR